MNWQDWLALVEFIAILYICLEDYRIRRLEEKSLDIDKRNYELYKTYFLERTRWYQARRRNPVAAGTDTVVVAGEAVGSPARSAANTDGPSAAAAKPEVAATQSQAAEEAAPSAPDADELLRAEVSRQADRQRRTIRQERADSGAQDTEIWDNFETAVAADRQNGRSPDK